MKSHHKYVKTYVCQASYGDCLALEFDDKSETSGAINGTNIGFQPKDPEAREWFDYNMDALAEAWPKVKDMPRCNAEFGKETNIGPKALNIIGGVDKDLNSVKAIVTIGRLQFEFLSPNNTQVANLMHQCKY
ncbi:hypothetical protein LY76DRAFT_650633 [Colletotrichum caudatum]|nr:hypothetical protein LY76DRAFT_650633 [Colletotrichum caudatum]